MPTNNFVESSFWNFDALFQPQAHPSRDAHDTFFLKGARCRSPHVSSWSRRARAKTRQPSLGRGARPQSPPRR